MNDIKKLIQMLKEHQKPYIGHDYIFYGIEFCNPQVQMCIEALEKQLNGGWISVSEGLPEKSDVYLATFLEEGKRYVERFYYSDFMGWMMPVAWQDEGRIENIIAWQPLPPAYKEVENDK